MRQISEIMEELGFNKEAPEGAQKAFIKNLIKEANRAKFAAPRKKANKQNEEASAISRPKAGEQMSFNFAMAPTEKNKKVS